MSKFAWVTLTTNDTYSLGALVLAHSLKRAGTQHQLAVLVTPGVSESMRSKLKDVYNVVQEVNIMDSQDSANLALLARPELGITFTKLHCWRLVQFEKCVFLDSDTLILQNCDELFEREEFSAAPDVSWPDCFNSGVFVYKPSQETFDKIVEFGLKNGSFDGGDQGLLNQYFSDWATSDLKKRLPFLYNVTAYASYCYLPAFKQFRDKIKILHFAGKMKPWLIHYNSQSKTPSVPSDYAHAADLIQLWWNIFFDHVHQFLTDNMRYSLPIITPWKSNYDNMSFQLQQHYEQQQQQQNEQQQHATNLQYNIKYENYQEQYTNKRIEFHDPWEDYYRKQETNAEIQTNDGASHINETSTGNENKENKWDDGKGYEQEVTKQDEEVQQQADDCHYDDDYHYDINIYEESTQRDFNKEPEIYKGEQIHNEAKQQNTTTASSSCECEVVVTSLHRDDKENDNNELEIKAITTETEIVDSQRETNNSDSITHDTSPTNRSIESNNVQVPNDNNNNNKETSANVGINNVCEQNEKKVEEAGLAGALSHLRLGEPRTPEQEAYEQLIRRQCWESGQVDYSGRDSFDNIWKKITHTLESKPDDKTDEFSDNNNDTNLDNLVNVAVQQVVTKQTITTTNVANVETTKLQQISRKSGSTKQKLSRKFK